MIRVSNDNRKDMIHKKLLIKNINTPQINATESKGTKKVSIIYIIHFLNVRILSLKIKGNS